MSQATGRSGSDDYLRERSKGSPEQLCNPRRYEGRADLMCYWNLEVEDFDISNDRWVIVCSTKSAELVHGNTDVVALGRTDIEPGTICYVLHKHVTFATVWLLDVLCL